MRSSRVNASSSRTTSAQTVIRNQPSPCAPKPEPGVKYMGPKPPKPEPGVKYMGPMPPVTPKYLGPKVDKFHWVPLFWVLASICAFGLLLKLTGVLVAGVGLVIGASYGGPEHKFREALILAIALTVFCAAVFVGGLKLPIPMCPGFEFFEQFSLCRF